MITSMITPVDIVTDPVTVITADLVAGRPQSVLRSGLLRAQQVRAAPGWTRIALIANTALLLGGDEVRLEVHVGTGARLEVFDVAGTVAYHGRGRPASMTVHACVADGAELIMAGEPFVVADGADVERSLELDVRGTGSALVRETVVLGRSGESGGRLRNRTRILHDGADVLREDQHLDGDTRRRPGVLGPHRVIDMITSVGPRSPAGPTDDVTDEVTEQVTDEVTEQGRAERVAVFGLLDGIGSLTRWIGTDLADSPLHARWKR